MRLFTKLWFAVILGGITLSTTANHLKIGWAHRDVSVSGPVGITGQFNLRISEDCNQVSSKGGQELVEETVKILKEIHSSK
jgi:hypothetical protein